MSKMLAILWTNSHLSEISGDLAAIKASHIDVLLSYLMTPTSTDADMTAYLDALDAAGLQAMLGVYQLGKNVVSGRTDKVLSSGELAAITTYVNKWKTHPAVWGWYADDESGAEYPIATRQQLYDTIKAAHPAGQVVECHYRLVDGAYSPDVHDVFAMDAGPIGTSYVYRWDDSAPYGSVSKATGLVTNPVNEGAALAGFKSGLDSYRAAVVAAGETQFLVTMQAFGQVAGGTNYSYAMPPPGGISKIWDQVHAAGWDGYAVGWFLWKSNDAATMPGENLDGVGETANSATMVAEIAAIAALEPNLDFVPPAPPVIPRGIAPILPASMVIVAGQDVTELVDMDTLHRSLSERGEASATIDIPVASENEVLINGLARDATVEIVVDGLTEWLGHVVAVHKPQPQDLAYVLDCAGGWDTLHHCAPWCKGFVETRYDGIVEFPDSWYAGVTSCPNDGINVDTEGEIRFGVPPETALPYSETMSALYYWLQGGLGGGYIRRITCQINAGDALGYGQGTIKISVGGGSPLAWDHDSGAIAGSIVETTNPATSIAFDSGTLAAATYKWMAVEFDISTAAQSSEQWAQLLDLRIYVDRTTAPRVDEIVAAVDADVRPLAPAASTEAIGSPLTAFMCDPFMTPADGIAVALTKAAVPPLCGVIQNQLVIKNRPTTPPDATRLWTVSEQITPGLEWGVEVDEEQSVDYVGVSYNCVGSGNLIPAMTSATAPSGVASASAIVGAGYEAWRAFDHLTTYGYDWAVAGTTGWLGYQFPTAHVFTGYAVTSRNDAAGAARVPKTWTFKGSNDGATWTTLDTQTNVTDWAASANVRKVFDFANTTAYAYGRLYITASNDASYVGVGELEMMETNVPDGTPRIAYYPSAPPNASARTALTDGGDLTAVEAAFYAQQGYYYLHALASGPVTIPYVVRDANGNERPADVIRAWDWVQNVGSLDAETAGPFLVSEVEHQGHIATLTIGAAEAYAYNGPDRMPTKGRYVGAHRVRSRTTQRVSFAKYWEWKHRKDKRKPKMPKRHAKYGTIRGFKWTDVEGRYV